MNLVVGLGGGIIFLLLDFVLNANSLAQRLNEPYRPIARKKMPLAAAMVIDLCYGLVMAGIFLLLRPVLPGSSVLVAGTAFGLLTWFFRVLMSGLSQWVMFDIPAMTLLYLIAAGLVEMVALGLYYAVAFSSLP